MFAGRGLDTIRPRNMIRAVGIRACGVCQRRVESLLDRRGVILVWRAGEADIVSRSWDAEMHEAAFRRLEMRWLVGSCACYYRRTEHHSEGEPGTHSKLCFGASVNYKLCNGRQRWEMTRPRRGEGQAPVLMAVAVANPICRCRTKQLGCTLQSFNRDSLQLRKYQLMVSQPVCLGRLLPSTLLAQTSWHTRSTSLR